MTVFFGNNRMINPVMEFAFNNQLGISEKINKYACRLREMLPNVLVGGYLLGLVAIGGSALERAADPPSGGAISMGVASVVVGIGSAAAIGTCVAAGVAAATRRIGEQEQRATRAFFNAILQNDLGSLPPESRGGLLDSYQTLMPDGMERFARTMTQQLVQSPSDPTELNTPAFLHPMLPEINRLRTDYRQLENTNDFSLIDLPLATVSADMRQLVVDGRNLAGRLNIGQHIIPWQLVFDCARSFDAAQIHNF